MMQTVAGQVSIWFASIKIIHLSFLQNDIYEWCRDHRVHHKFSETDADPHNSKRGFFFAHMGWLCVRKHPDVLNKGSTVDLSDLLEDPVVYYQKMWVWNNWPHSLLSILAILQSFSNPIWFKNLCLFVSSPLWSLLTYFSSLSLFLFIFVLESKSSSFLLITCSNHHFSHPFVFFPTYLSFDWLTLFLTSPFYLLFKQEVREKKHVFSASCRFKHFLTSFIFLPLLHPHPFVSSLPLICP